MTSTRCSSDPSVSDSPRHLQCTEAIRRLLACARREERATVNRMGSPSPLLVSHDLTPPETGRSWRTLADGGGAHKAAYLLNDSESLMTEAYLSSSCSGETESQRSEQEHPGLLLLGSGTSASSTRMVVEPGVRLAGPRDELGPDRLGEEGEFKTEVEIEGSCTATEAAEGCVAAGVDLLYLIRHNHVEAAEAFLRHWGESPLDFRRGDLDVRRTAMHWACVDGMSDSDTCRLLRAIVDRVETHPLDLVDWSLEDLYGDNLIAIAAENQKLSLVWPIVKDQPYFADHVDPIPLSGWFWQWDWEALGEEEWDYFDPRHGEAFPASQSTGELTRLCVGTQFSPDPMAVQACVRAGADVTFLVFLLDDPFLHRFLQRGNVDCVRACLLTPHPIDFTVTDGALSANPLHYILLPFPPVPFQNGLKRGVPREEGGGAAAQAAPKRKSPEVVAALLHLVLDRLESGGKRRVGRPARMMGHRGGKNWMADQVDWSQEMSAGLDFLNLAAFYGHLALVWSILKKRKVRYFFPRGGAILRAAHQMLCFHHREPAPAAAAAASSSSPSSSVTGEGGAGGVWGRTGSSEGVFPIRVPVHPEDWAALPYEDKSRFRLEKGFEESVHAVT